MEMFRVSPSIGAEVRGVDLSASLSASLAGELAAGLDAHGALFFRDQALDEAGLLALGRCFGELSRYPFVAGLDAFPDIVEVYKAADAKVNFGGVWHTDTAYLATPPGVTALAARELPDHGGDTLFASTEAAYLGLSPALRALLCKLRAVNTSNKSDAALGRAAAATVNEVHTASHPVVRRHPRTGRAALYVNRGHSESFEGMSVSESRGLLEFLFEHISQPEYGLRFRWQPGSVAVWDNCSAQHYAVNDYHGHARRLWRVTTRGERPRPAES